MKKTIETAEIWELIECQMKWLVWAESRGYVERANNWQTRIGSLVNLILRYSADNYDEVEEQYQNTLEKVKGELK